MTDEHKTRINQTWKEFQERERGEGGIGAKPEEVPQATTPASYSQQYMGDDPSKPSEIPIDPETKQELPVSKYNPRKGQYPISDPTSETPEDIERARKQMLAQRAELDEPETGGTFDRRGTPSQKGGEAVPGSFQDIKSILSVPIVESDGDYWRNLDEDNKSQILKEHDLLTGLEDGWDWDQLSSEARDKIRELSTEGGRGSGKKDHKPWMKGIEEDPQYKNCPHCQVFTENLNGRCQMCKKKV